MNNKLSVHLVYRNQLLTVMKKGQRIDNAKVCAF